jgi:dTDP-4-amino-4,6-dideoxygalactose transaminase
MIARLVPAGLNGRADGLEFKRAAISGELTVLAEALRAHPLLIVGPNGIAALGHFFAHPDAAHVLIHEREARGARHDIFAAVCQAIEGRTPPPVVLLQAGSLSTWLTIKLRERFVGVSILDLGVVLNLCNIPLLAGQNWAKVYWQPLAATIAAINPGWSESESAYPGIASAEERHNIWTSFSTGRDGALVALAARAGCERPARPVLVRAIMPGPAAGTRPLAFIENKVPDYDRVRQIMALSERCNAYANGGPVSRLLEDAVAGLIGLGEERKAIAVASGTAGLHVLAGLEAIKRGRHLRWISPAFTFFSANTGPLENCALTDCNVFGVLDRRVLERLDPAGYDGVIYTNVFAANPNIEGLAAFCAEHDKALIVDNATGLLDPPICTLPPPPQAISCHHTKPWGFGEGGVIVIDAADEALARQLVNFGNGAPDWARRYGMNGKVSDASCALILDRIERMPAWRSLYRMQVRRIMALIEQNELPLKPLWRAPPKSPMSSVPLLASHPVSPAMLANEHLVLRKYYRPLNWTRDDVRSGTGGASVHPAAEDIFMRIVNVPAHSGLAALAEDDIVDVLRSICASVG